MHEFMTYVGPGTNPCTSRFAACPRMVALCLGFSGHLCSYLLLSHVFLVGSSCARYKHTHGALQTSHPGLWFSPRRCASFPRSFNFCLLHMPCSCFSPQIPDCRLGYEDLRFGFLPTHSLCFVPAGRWCLLLLFFMELFCSQRQKPDLYFTKTATERFL